MNTEFFHTYHTLLLIASIGSFSLASLAIRRMTNVSMSRYLTVMMILVGAWQLAYGMQFGSLPAGMQYSWLKVQHLMLALLPTLWLIFSINFTRGRSWLMRRSLLLLAVEPALTILIIASNSAHFLYWKDQPLSGDFSILRLASGPWLLFHIYYSVLVSLVGNAFLLRLYIQRASMRGFLKAIFVGLGIAVLGWLVDGLNLLNLAPYTVSPFAFGLTGLAFALALHQRRLPDIIPLARDIVIENMREAIIVLDPSNRIVDMNLTACSLLNTDRSQAINNPVEKVWSGWPAELTLPVHNNELVREISWASEYGRYQLALHISSISDSNNQLTGRLVVVRDITRQKANEADLQRRDKILEAINFAGEQFLTKKSWELSIHETLTRLGEASHMSRIFVCQNPTPEDTRQGASSISEWAAWGVPPAHKSSSKPPSLCQEALHAWAHLLGSGQLVYGRLIDFPPAERKFLEVRGAKSILLVPIFLEGTWWGTIGFEDHLTEREWSNVEVDTLRAAANTIGAAIQRRQAEDEAQRLADVNSTLLNLSETIGSTLDIPQVLDRLVLSASSLLPADHIMVLLWDERQNALIPSLPLPGSSSWAKAPASLNEWFSNACITPGQVPLVAELLQNRRPIAVVDVTQNPLLPAEIIHDLGVRSVLVVPILFQEDFIGAIYADYCSYAHIFTEQEIELIQALAHHAGLAIERARLYTTSQADREELAALYRASSELFNPGRDMAALGEQITRVVRREFASAYCSVFVKDHDEKMLTLLAESGIPHVGSNQLPLDGPGLTVYAANHNEIVCVPDVSKDPRYLASSYAVRSELDIPLSIGGQVIGILNMESPELDGFSPRDKRILTAFANDAALALQNVRLFRAAEIHARQVVLLNEITNAALEDTDFDVLLHELANRMLYLINSNFAYITLWDADKQRAIPAAASGELHQAFSTSEPVAGENTLTADVLRAGHPIAVEDIDTSDYAALRTHQYPSISLLGLPLITAEAKIGAVLIGFSSAHHFTSREMSICQQAAGQVALIIARALSLQEARKLAQEADNLRQAAATLTSTLQEDEAVHLILDQLARVIPFDSAAVQLLRDGYLEIVGGIGWEDISKVVGQRFLIPSDNPNTLVIQQRQAHILEDARAQFQAFRQKPHDHIRSWMGVPLIVHEQVIGMLSMDSRQVDHFNQEHVRLATAFADQVAIVIDNARLFEAEQRRRQEAAAIAEVVRDVSSSLQLNTVLERIAIHAKNLLGTETSAVYICDPHEPILHAVAALGPDADEIISDPLIIGEGILGDIAAQKAAEFVNNNDTDTRSITITGTQDSPFEHLMGVPILFKDELTGLIAVWRIGVGLEFKQTELDFLNSLAGQAAVAIENARLYQAARQDAERRAVLHRVSQEVVTAGTNSEQLYEAIYKAVTELMPAEAFVIALLDDQQRYAQGVYLIDKNGRSPAKTIPTERGLTGRIIKSRSSLYIRDFAQDRLNKVTHYGIEAHTRSILAVPLRLGDRMIGMISAQSYQPNAYNTEDQHMLEMLAATAAIAIENARLFQETQKLAFTDPLTGLYNRRRLFELGEREVERFQRFDQPFSALMLDIDHFKSINDTYGHSMGDQVLQALAQQLNSQIRELDIIGRYGGEEIVVLMAGTNLQDAQEGAERLRSAVEGMVINTDEGEIKVTISIGVAEFRRDIHDLASLIDRADSSMYVAKSLGRNQVCAYIPLSTAAD